MPPIQWAEQRQRCRVGPTEPSRIAAEMAYKQLGYRPNGLAGLAVEHEWRVERG